MKDMTYVLITPARNEEENIGRLMESVVNQTLPPIKWVIVSDNSTDRTEEIVKSYSEQFDFIEMLALKSENGRAFTSMADAVKAGYARLQDLHFAVVTKIDADISFGPDCFEVLMRKFASDAQLGRVGPALVQHANEKKRPHLSTPEWHVSGGLEMFRRECYEQMDGLKRLAHGGTDTVADIMARMHGWKVKTFPEVEVVHHGRVGEIQGSMFRGRFHYGVQDYSLGYHPLFFLVKLLRRLAYKPYLLGSAQQGLGYLCAFLRREKYAVDEEVIEFLRKEQKERLLTALKQIFN